MFYFNPAMRLVVLYDGNEQDDPELYVREPDQAGLTRIAPVGERPPENFPAPPPPPSWFKSELDTGSVDTLRSFISWAQRTYPLSPRSMISIADHGGGWAADEGEIGQPRGASRWLVPAAGLV